MKLLSLFVVSSLGLSFAPFLDAAQRPAKPNVILVLTDDLGWQDVGCYDIDEPTPMETPNIDALATKGVTVLARLLASSHLCSHPLCHHEW